MPLMASQGKRGTLFPPPPNNYSWDQTTQGLNSHSASNQLWNWGPRFPLLYNGDNSGTYLVGLLCGFSDRVRSPVHSTESALRGQMLNGKPG